MKTDPFPKLLAVLLLAVALPAVAALTRDQAAAVAQRESGGRVLAVDKAEAGGRSVWRVKVVTQGGEVRVLLVDADSGRVQ